MTRVMPNTSRGSSSKATGPITKRREPEIMSNLRTKVVIADNSDEFLFKVWTDQEYAETLMRNPKAAIEQMGGFVPGDVDLRVVRDTDQIAHVHIPAAPTEREISEVDLMGAQGGTTLVCLSAVGGAMVSVFSAQIYQETTKL
ncbi:hypothetical protein Q5Y75_06555 [Ruegeria sp. 2205SS24-7]|uniref:hypothetical protein n=1 Tax=Ruegeria discodermiae TaxID=3064389 RepID=UPI0027429C26|nr:hypothetical protein [Ruegeria sp. 2205SS24-7]MDP5216873.1 hypothetical protein [Ruegeria sp. 2205SS24-7]